MGLLLAHTERNKAAAAYHHHELADERRRALQYLGMMLYVSNCVFCHGVPAVDKGGNIPNLAYVGREYIEHLDKFVFKGPFMDKGMPDFTGKLSADDVTKIQASIQGTADAVRPKPAATAASKP